MAQTPKPLKLLMWLAIILGVLQYSIPQFPADEATKQIITAVLFYAVSTVTLWRQYVVDVISNTATKWTWAVVLIATLTGAVDLIPTLHIPDNIAQYIKFVFTTGVAVLNVISQGVFPTAEAVQAKKDEEWQTK